MASPGDAQIEAWFPNLKPGDYEISSPESVVYNCIAWALGKNDAWWQAGRAPGYHWPEGIPEDGRIESVAAIFKLLGFEECESAAVEAAYEKVAIYGHGDEYEHAARQLPNGKWTSKLGCYKDIEHDRLDGLTGNEYGTMATVLRRRVDLASSP